MSKKPRGTAAEQNITKKTRRRAGKADEITPQRSNKTPQVMRLIEQDKQKGAANPVILAGKSRIPRQLAGREPLSRILRRDLDREFGEEFSDIDGTVVVNLTQLALEHEAPLILDRFNACSCDRCVEVISMEIAKRVPVRFARVKKSSRHSGSSELMERMEPVRKMVLTEMIRELIGNKKRCFHDD